MNQTKILRRDNTPTEELQEIVKRTFEGVDFSYKAVYYLDYEVDEYTGMINKEKLVRFCTKKQMNQNLKACKEAYSTAKAGIQ